MIVKYFWPILILGIFMLGGAFFALGFMRLYVPEGEPSIDLTRKVSNTPYPGKDVSLGEKEVSGGLPPPPPSEFLVKNEFTVVTENNDVLKGSSLLKVPFTVQAPYGDWGNPVFQNGCEEAAVFMAMLWVEGRVTTPSQAEKAILALANFEQKNYGNFIDSSAADTMRLMRDYFGYNNVFLKSNINKDDIKAELADGNLVIVPVNGQMLRNPYYKPPGPLQHMVIVRGYNAARKTFITNDPGTKRGEAFQYPEDRLEDALQDYRSGNHLPILAINKVMIVVRPSS